LTICFTSFFTPPVQLIFPILLQHHISQLSRYFWSTFRSVQFAAPSAAIPHMQHFTGSLLRFTSSLLVQIVFLLSTADFAMAVLNLILHLRHASLETHVLKMTSYKFRIGIVFLIIQEFKII
jgi:hypothetical protein